MSQFKGQGQWGDILNEESWGACSGLLEEGFKWSRDDSGACIVIPTDPQEYDQYLPVEHGAPTNGFEQLFTSACEKKTNLFWAGVVGLTLYASSTYLDKNLTYVIAFLLIAPTVLKVLGQKSFSDPVKSKVREAIGC